MISSIDIGDGHTIRYFGWAPDRDLNPQYEGIDDVEKYGVSIGHLNPRTGEPCSGFVTFDSPTAQRLDPDRPRWTVESWEPLTISPSVLCMFPSEDGQECGDHGFIREGRWVAA